MENSKQYPYLRQVFFKMLMVRLFIPLMIVGIIGCIGTVYLTKNQVEAHEEQVTRSIAHIINYHIDHGKRVLEAVSRTAEESKESDLSVFMKSAWEAYGYFETIYYLDNDDKILFMSPSDSNYNGLDMSNIPDFKKTDGQDNFILSRPFISIRTGEPTIYLVRPLSKGGYIVGELNLAIFQQEVENITRSEGYCSAFIMDQAGTLLAHPILSLVKEQYNMSNLGIFSKTSLGNVSDMYLYDGKLVLGSGIKLEEIGWVVIAQIPLSTFISSYAWVFIITILAMLTIGLSLILGLRKPIHKHIITPIEQLTKSTNELAIGDFSKGNSISSIYTSFAEIHNLMVDFQLMSRNLQQRENALMESETRNRGLVNRMRVGLFRATLDGQIQTINPMGRSILKNIYNNNSMKINIVEFLTSAIKDDSKKEFMINNKYNLNNFEFEIQCLDNTTMWIKINSYIVGNLKDQPEYFEGTIHNITERKKTELKIKDQREQIIKSEKEKREALEKSLAMKDEFISLISHEFKTPLNVIYSAIQLIECVYLDKIPERVQQLIANIKQNTFRQLRLTNNLLDITKMNSGQFKLNKKNIDIVFLTKVIAESVELYANQKNINISFEADIDSKIISIDEEKYERIVLNILSNAMKFTESDGKINIAISELENTNFIQIKIRDTGIGIPEDKIDIIFERFGQVDSNLSRRAEGTGIGLSLVKVLVDNFGGKIEVESELGVGSIFIVTLPANNELIENEPDALLDVEDRLVSEIKVQFSDIYL